jgi:hypothetical protein
MNNTAEDRGASPTSNSSHLVDTFKERTNRNTRKLPETVLQLSLMLSSLMLFPKMKDSPIAGSGAQTTLRSYKSILKPDPAPVSTPHRFYSRYRKNVLDSKIRKNRKPDPQAVL